MPLAVNGRGQVVGSSLTDLAGDELAGIAQTKEATRAMSAWNATAPVVVAGQDSLATAWPGVQGPVASRQMPDQCLS